MCPPRAENRHPASYRGSGNTQLSCALQYLYLRSHWANKARLLFAPLCLPSFFTQGICQHLLSMLSGQTCKIPESHTQAVYLVKLISMTQGEFFFLQELIISLAPTYILKSTHFLKCTRRVLYFTTCLGSIPWKRMGSTDGLR